MHYSYRKWFFLQALSRPQTKTKDGYVGRCSPLLFNPCFLLLLQSMVGSLIVGNDKLLLRCTVQGLCICAKQLPCCICCALSEMLCVQHGKVRRCCSWLLLQWELKHWIFILIGEWAVCWEAPHERLLRKKRTITSLMTAWVLKAIFKN